MANANTLRLSGLSAADTSNSSTSREHLTDPLDIFGEITNLIAQGLGPDVLENLPESSLGAGAVSTSHAHKTEILVIGKGSRK